jgi:osmotically-inducible protein OsmY
VRTLLAAVLVVVLAFVAYSYWSGSAYSRFPRAEPPAVGTSGTVEKARETGAQIGEKVGEAAVTVKETVDEAAITSKIKAKMVLDDSVRARAIDVSTRGSTVTLSGTVQSPAEHDRAVRLARETAGVTAVTDHLIVQPPDHR